MRTMEFKMERTNFLDIGDLLPVTEYGLPGGFYYILGKSYAMSANIPKEDRLSSQEGRVSDIKETERGFYVTVEFDEESSGSK